MPIIIDIDSIREACNVEIDENIMHKEVYKHILRSISEIYLRINHGTSSSDSSIKKRTHDIIGVFGRRGTGKTTVLLSILNDIQKGKNSTLQEWKSNLSGAQDMDFDNLIPLPVVDPTMMGTKEHMLLRVVNLIRDYVEREFGRQSPIQDAEWGQNFRRLVQGIVNLEVAGDAHQELFYDEFAASEKMNAIVHVEELEGNFTKFINNSLNLLKKKAFVLAIDDMDTNPGAAWASLECIRKYFTSPQLIVLLAGDLDMFTEIIRAEQRKFFNFQPSDALGNFDSRPQMHIETLVEQYLLKLIPMMHRVEVQSFLWSARKELDKFHLYDLIEIRRFGETYSFSELINHFNKDWGLHLPILMEAYDKILLDTPLRTTREIFNYLVESYAQFTIEDKRTGNQRQSHMVLGLTNIFTNALSQFGYSNASQELYAMETPKGIVDLLDKLVLHGLLHANNDDLTPRQHPIWLASSLVVIQGALSHALRNEPGVALHYLLKVSVFKELTNRKGLLPTDKDKYRELRDNLHLADGIPLSDTGKYLAGLVPCSVDSFSYAHGLGTILLDVPGEYLHFPQWGSLYPLLGIYQRQMPAGMIPAFSIWFFIGLMGDVLLSSSEMLLDEVVRALPYPQTVPSQGIYSEEKTLLPRKSHLLPGIKPDIEPNSISKRTEGIKTLLGVWRNDITEWMKSEKFWAISATLFPRIANCYINYLQALDQHQSSEAQSSADFAASYVKNCALLFLQAVLIEESRLMTNTSPLRSLSLAAPIDIEINFIYNCQTINNFFGRQTNTFSTIMPFFALCCTFPLWPLLLGGKLVSKMLKTLHLPDYSINKDLKCKTDNDKSFIAGKSVLEEMGCNMHDNDMLLLDNLNLAAASFPHSPKTNN